VEDGGDYDLTPSCPRRWKLEMTITSSQSLLQKMGMVMATLHFPDKGR